MKIGNSTSVSIYKKMTPSVYVSQSQTLNYSIEHSLWEEIFDSMWFSVNNTIRIWK